MSDLGAHSANGRIVILSVLSHAYVPAIHVFAVARPQDVDARHKAGHDDERECPIPRRAEHDTRRTKRRDGRLSLVMAGRSRPKDGVLSHAYAPGHYSCSVPALSSGTDACPAGDH